MERANGETSAARFDAGLVLDGCGIAGVLTEGDRRIFLTLGYHERFGRWVQMTLNNRPGEGHAFYIGAEGGAGAALAEAPVLAIRNEHDAYLTTQAFSGDGGLERYLWEAIDSHGVTLRRQTRSDAAAAWRTEETWRLRPAS